MAQRSSCRIRLALALVLIAAGALELLTSARLAAQGPISDGISVARRVMIPMRDGVKLATDIYFPAKDGVPVPGKYPAILERTPYNRAGIDGWARYFAPRGYVAVGQDVRGRYDSEGSWRLHRDDQNDGFDTAKWIAAQPWSSGAVGTVGTSYPGGTQHALALSNPPALKAMVPIDAMSNYGRYGVRHNGAFERSAPLAARGEPRLSRYGPPDAHRPAGDSDGGQDEPIKGSGLRAQGGSRLKAGPGSRPLTAQDHSRLRVASNDGE